MSSTKSFKKEKKKGKGIKSTKCKVMANSGGKTGGRRGEKHTGRAVVLVTFQFLSWAVNS